MHDVADLFRPVYPYLLWSSDVMKNGLSELFQYAMGQPRNDGRNHLNENTNMTQAGQLGTPLTYDRREIFLFPEEPEQFSRWTEMIQHSKVGDTRPEWDAKGKPIPKTDEYEDMEFFPNGGPLLPIPADFASLGWRHYFDLPKQAEYILGLVRKQNPPIKLVRSVRRFESCESIGVRITSDKKYDGIVTYAVFVGTMWCPKPFDEKAQKAD